jgi:hypothetical protein
MIEGCSTGVGYYGAPAFGLGEWIQRSSHLTRIRNLLWGEERRRREKGITRDKDIIYSNMHVAEALTVFHLTIYLSTSTFQY